MTSLLAFVLTTATAATSANPRPTADADCSRFPALESLVDRHASAGEFSGVVLVARHGEAVCRIGRGLANRTTGEANRFDTRFNLGSLNKMFTAVAIARLVEAGKLSYDDTIAEHLPDYPNAEVARRVTIRHLLTHTSGLGSYFNPKFFERRATLSTLAAHLPLFADDPLQFAPGDGWTYSNAGFLILGLIVERVSGRSYPDYVRDEIFAPAGMTQTGFYAADGSANGAAVGYTRFTPQGPGDEWRDNGGLREITGGPAGGGLSTADDLVRFAEALRAHRLLSPAQTDTVTSGKVSAPMGMYAFGFGVQGSGSARRFGHTGGGPGIAALLHIYPESGVEVVILANQVMPAPRMTAIADAARDLLR